MFDYRRHSMNITINKANCNVQKKGISCGYIGKKGSGRVCCRSRVCFTGSELHLPSAPCITWSIHLVKWGYATAKSDRWQSCTVLTFWWPTCHRKKNSARGTCHWLGDKTIQWSPFEITAWPISFPWLPRTCITRKINCRVLPASTAGSEWQSAPASLHCVS